MALLGTKWVLTVPQVKKHLFVWWKPLHYGHSHPGDSVLAVSLKLYDELYEGKDIPQPVPHHLLIAQCKSMHIRKLFWCLLMDGFTAVLPNWEREEKEREGGRYDLSAIQTNHAKNKTYQRSESMFSKRWFVNRANSDSSVLCACQSGCELIF